MFSDRVPGNLTPNRLTDTLRQIRSSGTSVIDLTQSNPTQAGLPYPDDLLAPLGDAASLVYRPQAVGLASAREAVAADYARRGYSVSPDRLVLTASTSEAYSLLFKILGNHGDTVLIPRPSYPLLEHLARLDGLGVRFYDLEYHGRWSVDLSSLERAMTGRTCAVIAVSPNNPTGSFLKVDELSAVQRLCAAHGAALIVDEVFADYRLTDGGARVGNTLEDAEALTFALGGLSKSIGLPQLKLGWIATSGPAALVESALGRLEFVADTYLSVSTPVQTAAHALLDRGQAVRAAIADRVSANYQRLRTMVPADSGCGLLLAEGGWYGVLQVPSLSSEEDLVVTLLSRYGVLVHPGYFFDFSRESFLVVSLLPPEPLFAEGVERILRHCACSATAP